MKLKSESHSMPMVNSAEGKKTLENDVGAKYLSSDENCSCGVLGDQKETCVVNSKGR